MGALSLCRSSKEKISSLLLFSLVEGSTSAEIVGTSPRSGNSVIYREARFSRG